MSLAQRQGLITGFTTGLTNSLQAVAARQEREAVRDKLKDERQLDREISAQRFEITKDLANRKFDLLEEQTKVDRETNRIAKFSTASSELARFQAGVNTAGDQVSKAQAAVEAAKENVIGSRNSASSLKGLTAAESALQTALTEQESIQGAFDVAQQKVDTLSQPVKPPVRPARQPIGSILPPAFGAIPEQPTTQEAAEEVAQVETAQVPAEVVQEGILDLSDVARGGQSIQERLADTAVVEVAPAEPTVPDAQLPEGQKSGDVAAAQALGVTPKANLKFRASEDLVSKTGQVTPGPRLESSEQVSSEVQFSDINEAVQTQAAKGAVKSIKKLGLDQADHLEKFFSGDLNTSVLSTNNLEKIVTGLGKWLKTPETQGLMKKGQSRSNIHGFVDNFASNLAANLDEQKFLVISPNEQIALDNGGRLADALFVLRDQLIQIDTDINASLKESGGIVIDAEIIMPDFDVDAVPFEKQFFGKTPKSKKVPAPKGRSNVNISPAGLRFEIGKRVAKSIRGENPPKK